MNTSRHCYYLFLVIFLTFPYRLHAQEVDIALPDTLVSEQGASVIPLTVSDVSGMGITSFQFELVYDSAVIDIDEVASTDFLPSDFLVIPNIQPGRTIVAGAGISTLSGQGVMLELNISFKTIGVSNLVFENFSFEVDSSATETPTVNITNGRIRNSAQASREEEDLLAAAFTLQGNYPNPFRGTTEVVMDLIEPVEVGIRIYNVYGQLVRSISPRPFAAGLNQSIAIDVSSLSAGSYIYRVSVSNHSGTRTAETKTMTIIR